MIFIYSNNVRTTLANALSPSSSVITLTSMSNAPTSFPTGAFWEITLNDEATKTVFEICYATAYLGGGQYAVLRGQEGTTAQAWLSGDFAFGSVTAAMLGNFVQQFEAGNFVELNPPSEQSGSIDVTGPLSVNAEIATNAGVSAGGSISGSALSASGGVSGAAFASTSPFGSVTASSLALTANGSAGTVGIGPSSGLSFGNGAHIITGTTCAIAQGNSGMAIDANGNIGISGTFNGYGINANEVVGNLIYYGEQGINAYTTNVGGIFGPGGDEVVDTISCPDGSIVVTKSGHNVSLSNAGGNVSSGWTLAGFKRAASGAIDGIAISDIVPSDGSYVYRCTATVNGGGVFFTASLSLFAGHSNGDDAVINATEASQNAFAELLYIATFGPSQTVTFTVGISAGGNMPGYGPNSSACVLQLERIKA